MSSLLIIVLLLSNILLAIKAIQNEIAGRAMERLLSKHNINVCEYEMIEAVNSVIKEFFNKL